MRRVDTDFTIATEGAVFAPRRTRFGQPADIYDDDWAILAPQAGSFWFEVDLDPAESGLPMARGGIVGECEFGDVVVCPPHTVLRRRITDIASFVFLRFTTDAVFPVGRTRFGDVDRLASSLHYLSAPPPVAEPAAGLARLLSTHMVKDLLVTLLWEDAHSAPTEDPLMRKAASYITQHALSPDLSLYDLSQHLGLSRSQLSRRFRTAHGTTPVAYARAIRLQQARQLLLETDETLHSIAAQCGFRNAFYFSRVFTKEMSQAPTAYREHRRL